MHTALDRTVDRVVAILAALAAIRILPQLASLIGVDAFLPDGAEAAAVWIVVGTIASFGLLLAVAIAFARRSLAPVTTDGPAVAASAADVHAVLLSVAGVVLVGLALGNLPSDAWSVAVAHSDLFDRARDGGTVATDRTYPWLALTGSILQAAGGLVLVFRPGGVVRRLRRRRGLVVARPADARCPHCGTAYRADAYRPDAPAYLCGHCGEEIPVEGIRPATHARTEDDSPLA